MRQGFSLRHIFVEVQGRLLWISPKLRVAIHHNASQGEKDGYRQLMLKSGAKKVSLVDRSFAAAMGAGIPVDEACGYMVVNIGASTTEISVLALDRVAHFSRIHVGGDMMNKAICSYLEKKYKYHCRILKQSVSNVSTFKLYIRKMSRVYG